MMRIEILLNFIANRMEIQAFQLLTLVAKEIIRMKLHLHFCSPRIYQKFIEGDGVCRVEKKKKTSYII